MLSEGLVCRVYLRKVTRPNHSVCVRKLGDAGKEQKAFTDWESRAGGSVPAAYLVYMEVLERQGLGVWHEVAQGPVEVLPASQRAAAFPVG